VARPGRRGLLAILVIVSIVIVMNTIRTAVYHRRKEIEVMKLVGATEWFVRGPFVIEGIMTGLIAAAIALSLLVIAYPPAVQQFRSDIASSRSHTTPASSRAWLVTCCSEAPHSARSEATSACADM